MFDNKICLQYTAIRGDYMNKMIEKFMEYVKIDTQSDEESTSIPSSQKQFDLAKILVEDLKEIGASNVELDKYCNVWAEIPSNSNKNIPTIGLIAHMDTATDFTGANVEPKLVKNYDGKDIVLNEEKQVILKTEDFPEILQYVGEDIITTDGTTLLGADNKAGIVEIISVAEHIINNPSIEHGTIKIAFTPDEEIGRGVDQFDVDKFGVDFAYTVDGGARGELEYENFNAASAKITIQGNNIHPGSAKNMMVNSIRIANELDSMLPVNEKPEYTEEYEGFFHLCSIKGDVEETKLSYIIRDHDKFKFEQKKDLLRNIVQLLNKKYIDNPVKLEINDQYYNMKGHIEPVMHIVDVAKNAMEELGITPLITPIRGGTDGAVLSYKGVPTPNLFTGGHNFHGKYEYIPINSMKDAVAVILKIIEIYSRASK